MHIGTKQHFLGAMLLPEGMLHCDDLDVNFVLGRRQSIVCQAADSSCDSDGSKTIFYFRH